MNTIKITTTNLGPHLMMITKRRTMMERGIRPTLECLSDKDYDEGLLRPRVVCGAVWKFKVKKHRFLYNHNFFSFFCEH
jgi:hypothetical protein